MKSADELRLSFIRANRGRLTMTDRQYASWLRRVVDEDRRRRTYVEVTDPARPTWDAWRVVVPPPSLPPGFAIQLADVEYRTHSRLRHGRGTRADLVILDEATERLASA